MDQTLKNSMQLLQRCTFTEKANQIIDYTRQGKGTIGQLFMGDESIFRV